MQADSEKIEEEKIPSKFKLKNENEGLGDEQLQRRNEYTGDDKD